MLKARMSRPEATHLDPTYSLQKVFGPWARRFFRVILGVHRNDSTLTEQFEKADEKIGAFTLVGASFKDHARLGFQNDF
jgi:hypothetical protein